MQSFLQYRRIGRHARDQYERDRKRTEALDRGNADNEAAVADLEEVKTHRSSSIDNAGSPDSTDLEKAELSRNILDPHGGKTTEIDSTDLDLHLAQGDLQKIATANTSKTTQSFGSRLDHAMSGIEVRHLSKAVTRTRPKWTGKGRTLTDERDEERETVFVVGYESDSDPLIPHGWSYATRINATVLIASISFIVGYASSTDSSVLKQASEESGISEVTEILATGLFLVGFGFGALVSLKMALLTQSVQWLT